MACDSGEYIDRITELPEEIRERILGHLPITDAVRTSVLKKKWRHSWKTATHLNLYFDEDLERDMTEDMYFRMVARVFLAHIGPIHKIVLRPLWYENEGDTHIWLELLSRKGVNDLTIYCEDRIENFDLPASLFYCVELASLTLGRCRLVNSVAFRGFANLVRLELFEVSIHGDILEKIIASSALEILFIRSCNFNFYKTAISAPNLRVFSITSCYFGLDYIYLKNTLNVTVASFMLEMAEDIEDLKSNCFHVFGSLPMVERVTFDCRQHKTSNTDIIPDKHPGLLEKLRTMTLYCVDAISMDIVSFMFCIIRSSPNLQNLDIHTTDMYRTSHDKVGLKAVSQYLDVVCREGLKTNVTTISVTMELVKDTECMEAEINLISSVVSCCPILASLFVKTCPTLRCAVELQLSRVLERLGSSSSKPQVIYSS